MIDLQTRNYFLIQYFVELNGFKEICEYTQAKSKGYNVKRGTITKTAKRFGLSSTRASAIIDKQVRIEWYQMTQTNQRRLRDLHKFCCSRHLFMAESTIYDTSWVCENYDPQSKGSQSCKNPETNGCLHKSACERVINRMRRHKLVDFYSKEKDE